MKQVIFPLRLRHHTSINNIRADQQPFFTWYIKASMNEIPDLHLHLHSFSQVETEAP